MTPILTDGILPLSVSIVQSVANRGGFQQGTSIRGQFLPPVFFVPLVTSIVDSIRDLPLPN